jgi:ribonuclease HI
MVTKKAVERSLYKLKELLTGQGEAESSIELLLQKLKTLDGSLFSEKKEKTTASYPLPENFKLADSIHKVALFCDGACRGNPGPGSWASVAQVAENEFLFTASGFELLTTNNKMELEGVIQGLEQIREQEGNFQTIFVYSDSKYVVEGIEKWVIGWKKRGWLKADNKPPENLELWKNLDRLKESFNRIEFHWIKGHAGHPQNEYCDRMANQVLDESGY